MPISRLRAAPAVLVLALGAAACTPSEEKVTGMAQQAQQLLDAGQPAQAQALILKAVHARDDLPAVYLVQAHIALALGRRGEAYQAYANALSLEATNPEALLGAAQTGLGSGHVEEAGDDAAKVLVLNPGQPDALLIQGIIRLVRNDLNAAIGFADRVLAARPNDSGGLILKSRALALSGDRAGALALIQQGIKVNGPTLEMSMSLAELQRGGGDGPAFLAALQRVSALQPADRDVRFDIAETLYKLGRTDDARREVAGLLDEQIADPVELGRFARLWNGYDRDALTPEQIAHVADKAVVDVRLAVARYFIAAGRPQVAAAILKPVDTGWSIEVRALAARADAALGQGAAAIAAADQVIAKDPDNGDALLIKAQAALAGGDPASAVIAYQRVIRDYPQWDEGYLGLARAYAADRKPAGVRRAFEDGRAAAPQSLPIAAAYVAALPGLGDPAHAAEVARQFALASPALPKGWQLYASTCGGSGDPGCRAEAADGLAAARRRFGLDLPPGTPPPVALIGRLS